MLVVGLGIAVILIQHVGCSSLNLALNNSLPKFLGFDCLSAQILGFILVIQIFKLLAMHLIQPWGLIGTEQSPVSILHHSGHEQIGYPQSIEEVSGSLLFLSVVLPHGKEVEDVCMPWFQVHSK